MSPRKILKSCGSSSMRSRRSKLPVGVVRSHVREAAPAWRKRSAHCAEFVQPEGPAAEPWPLLPEDNGKAHARCNANSGEQHERSASYKHG